MGHKVFEDGVIDILTWPLGPYHNGVTAENVAEQYHVSREEQECICTGEPQKGCASHTRQVKVKDRIVPVELRTGREILLYLIRTKGQGRA